MNRFVMVPRADLEYLLAHFYDEVRGNPGRSHWRLPLLRDAADRLAIALDNERPPAVPDGAPAWPWEGT